MTMVPPLLVGGLFCGLAYARRAESETVHALRQQALRLSHNNACRRAEAELAKGKEFYLVLDPEQPSLSLKLRGTLLRQVPLLSLDVGRPWRFFFQRGTRDEQVRARLHRQGRLEPRRPLLRLAVEVLESPSEEARTIMLPPEPENAIPAPRTYFIRYDSGVTLEFHTDDGGIDLRQNIIDRFSAFFGGPELRLRLGLERKAREEFFRSVPSETDLLVL